MHNDFFIGCDFVTLINHFLDICLGWNVSAKDKMFVLNNFEHLQWFKSSRYYCISRFLQSNILLSFSWGWGSKVALHLLLTSVERAHDFHWFADPPARIYSMKVAQKQCRKAKCLSRQVSFPSKLLLKCSLCSVTGMWVSLVLQNRLNYYSCCGYQVRWI